MSTVGDTKEYSDLYPYIRTEVPGAEPLMMLQFVQQTVIEFLHRTQVWTRELDPINIVDGTKQYELDLDVDCAIIDRVLKVQVEEITQLPFADFIVVGDKTIIELKNEPTRDIAAGLVVWVSMRPHRDAEELEERIFEDWFDEIASGVIYRMARQNNRSWSNPNTAELHRRLYRDGIRNARIEVNRGSMNSELVADQSKGFVVSDTGVRTSGKSQDTF